MSQERTVYDEVPYQNHPYRRSHPDAIAVVGEIFGVETTPLDQARVLELGCGNGGNIIPFAYYYPTSNVVGIDLSSDAISSGRHLISNLGLDNIQLHHLDIEAIDSELGQFDYVICHGIYSWVAPHIRSAILTVCKNLLSKNGLAIISYNCLPGWHFRGLARELMQFHSQRFLDEPQLYIHQSRAILDFIANHVTDRDALYQQVIRNEARTVRELPDWHLFHDYLETHNHALYFHDFANQLAAAGLSYVSDTEIPKIVPQEFPENVQTMLGKFAGDIISLEQYLDFLRNRMFRRSVVCHQQLPLSRELNPAVMERFRFSCAMQESETVGSVTKFRQADGGALETDKQWLIALFRQLIAGFPRCVDFDALLRFLTPDLSKLPGTKTDHRRVLSSALMKFGLAGLIELRIDEPKFCTAHSDFPKATALARTFAKDHPFVANALHEAISLDDEQRALIQLCDGTRSTADLAAELSALRRSVGASSAESASQSVGRYLAYFTSSALIER